MQVRYQLRHRPSVAVPDNSSSLQHLGLCSCTQRTARACRGYSAVEGDGTSTGMTGQSFQRRSSA